jgi:hypothetical protein
MLMGTPIEPQINKSSYTKYTLDKFVRNLHSNKGSIGKVHAD